MYMSRSTGREITRRDSIRQSVEDIATTPIGTRVMRREYGSLVPFLIDQPLHEMTQLRVISALVDALARWEDRIDVAQIEAIEKHGCALRLQLGMRDAGTGATFSETVNLSQVS